MTFLPSSAKIGLLQHAKIKIFGLSVKKNKKNLNGSIMYLKTYKFKWDSHLTSQVNLTLLQQETRYAVT